MFQMLDYVWDKLTVLAMLKGMFDENIPVDTYPLDYDAIFEIWEDVITKYTDSVGWTYFEDNCLSVCVIKDKRIADFQRALSKYYTVFGEPATTELRESTYKKYGQVLDRADGVDYIIRQKHFNHILGTMAIYYWEEVYINYGLAALGIVKLLNGLAKEAKRIEEQLDQVEEKGVESSEKTRVA